MQQKSNAHLKYRQNGYQVKNNLRLMQFQVSDVKNEWILCLFVTKY